MPNPTHKCATGCGFVCWDYVIYTEPCMCHGKPIVPISKEAQKLIDELNSIKHDNIFILQDE